MKKTTLIAACLLLVLALSACGNTCKASGCDLSRYKSGYCEYHYALHALDSLFG